MKGNVNFLYFVVLLLGFGIFSFGDNKEEEIKLTIIPNGVKLGMSTVDLRSSRKNAKLLNFGIIDGKEEKDIDITKGEHLFAEKLAQDETFSAAVYGVKDDKLIAMSFESQGVIQDIRKLRQKVVLECVRVLGKEFESKATLQKDGNVDYLAPLFLWKKEDIMIAMSCTSEYQDVEIKKGFVKLKIWLEKSMPSPPLNEQKVTDDVVTRLAAPIKKLFDDKQEDKQH